MQAYFKCRGGECSWKVGGGATHAVAVLTWIVIESIHTIKSVK